MAKKLIIGITLRQLEEFVLNAGHKPELAREVCVSIYKRRCISFDEMHSIPLDLRKKLDKHFTANYLKPSTCQQSIDGTRKYLYRTTDGFPFESAFIPTGKRNTLCISTQSGCAMGCGFCLTGKLGFNCNLTPGEIVGQVLCNENFSKINRLVVMGMGEPLDNLESVLTALEILTSDWGLAFGAARITLSTVGLMPQLKAIVESKGCNIAISFHSPWPEVRASIMPIQRTQPFSIVLNYLKNNPLNRPLRLSFEYVIMPGINDSLTDCNEVVRILSEFKSIVNVIPNNSTSNNSISAASAKKFQQMLNQAGQPATLRLSKGSDIDAACGMMAGKDV